MAATYSSLIGVAVGGKYEVRRVLGAGGMGVVCEAVHLDLGKRVAVKLIDKSMKQSELIVARFRREARAAGQINSEHIVDVFDVGADPRVGLYMVMEYLVGEDLQSRLERDERIDVKTMVMIAQQIARGLHKAHEAGVIHRDLKPANIYLTERDNGQLHVKLLDFGVSKLIDEGSGSARITGTGTPIGTPLYMSPEQAEGKDDVDGRADVWSLGAVMYEALAGVPPFADRGSYHNTIIGILTSRPKLLHDAAPWVPAPLARVVDAMLVHDREARLLNAGAVAQRLLDAFPTVLPDGTGKHTAVIVSHAAAAVDTTGDTELFTSASMLAAARAGSSPASHPPGSGRSSDATSARGRVPPRTMAEPAAAALTGSASPVEGWQRDDASSSERLAPPPASSAVSGFEGSRGPRTAPLVAPPSSSTPSAHFSTPAPRRSGRLESPSSSADGVALMTPPVIEPLVPVDVAPTERERRRDRTPAADGAAPAPRRNKLFLVTVLLVMGAVGVGSFFAGRRAAPWARPTPPRSEVPAAPDTPSPPATPTTADDPSIANAASAALPAPPTTGTPAAPSASASAPRAIKKSRPRTPTRPDPVPSDDGTTRPE